MKLPKIEWKKVVSEAKFAVLAQGVLLLTIAFAAGNVDADLAWKSLIALVLQYFGLRGVDAARKFWNATRD